MRTTCLALFITATCLSVATPQQWRAQPVMQVLNPPMMVRDMAVSNTGNQIAWVNDNGLSIHYLRDSGGIGDLRKRINLPDLRKVGFVPGGQQVICAGGGGTVYLINRSTWEVRTVVVPDATFPAGIDTVTQRSQAYVSFWHEPYVASINFRDATLVDTAGSIGTEEWFKEGVAASPAGDMVVTIARSLENNPAHYNGRLVAYPLPLPEDAWRIGPSWERNVPDTPVACCVGPDPDHMLVLLGGADLPLNVVRFSDGEVSCPMNFGFTQPVAVDNSADGRFIIVADASGEFLKTISGADVRGLMDPNFNITMAQVRTFTIPLREKPAGVVFHPEKDVAYAWSNMDGKIWTVRVGLPDV